MNIEEINLSTSAMKRVLVTGGSGHLGRYVVRALSENLQVTVFDKKKPDLGCAFASGDILDRAAVAEAVSDQDAVVHLAALDLAVPATDSEYMRVNVEGTWNLFDCARAAGVRKAVHCSSVAAVNISPENPPRYLPVDVDHPADPTIGYDLSKLIGEKIARRFAALGGMDVICLRPTFVMQPDDVYDVAKTTAEADGTAPPPAAHPSWQSFGEVIAGSRSFVDPRDAAAAFKAALQTDGIPWGIFNVSSADSYSALPTLTVVEREFGVRPGLRNPERYAEGARTSIYDISATTKSLGWKPVHNWPSVLNEVLSAAQHES